MLAQDSDVEMVEKEALTPERFRVALEYGVQYVGEQLAREPDRQPALEREMAALRSDIEKMVQAIRKGSIDERPPEALVVAIAEAEGRIKEILAELARLASAPATLADLYVEDIERDVAQKLARFGDLLRGDVPQVRRALKNVLVDRVEFKPVNLSDGRGTYEFHGRLASGAILQDSVDTNTDAINIVAYGELSATLWACDHPA